jgi:hypothetical protein
MEFPHSYFRAHGTGWYTFGKSRKLLLNEGRKEQQERGVYIPYSSTAQTQAEHRYSKVNQCSSMALISDV